MIAREELLFMQKAYGILYEIENRLRIYATRKMEEEYGVNWKAISSRKIINDCTRTDFESLHFHQLVSYYKIFPNLTSSLPSDIYHHLFKLNSVRNKIAHNRLISKEELEDLININCVLDSYLKMK